MRRKVIMLLCCSTYFLACLGVAGCQSRKIAKETGMAVESKTAVKTASLLVSEEISLEGFEPEQFSYNPVDNLPVMISKKGDTYSVYERKGTYEWFKKVSYSCGKNEILDTFVYSTDGKMYCVRKRYEKDKRYQKKVLVRQNLMRGNKDGTLKEITLKNLGIKEIKDIRFEGTALAITFSDRSVKFYNIEERYALGADKIRGEAGKDVFYDFCYFTASSSSSGEPMIVDYDIRSGEKIKSFLLTDKSKSIRSVYLANYHENLYIMTEYGLYVGNYTDNIFYCRVKREDLEIEDLESLFFVRAARDNTLYYAWKDEKFRVHLAQINIPEKTKDSVFIEAKL